MKNMKTILLVITMLFTMIGCTEKTTTSDEISNSTPSTIQEWEEAEVELPEELSARKREIVDIYYNEKGNVEILSFSIKEDSSFEKFFKYEWSSDKKWDIKECDWTSLYKHKKGLIILAVKMDVSKEKVYISTWDFFKKKDVYEIYVIDINKKNNTSCQLKDYNGDGTSPAKLYSVASNAAATVLTGNGKNAIYDLNSGEKLYELPFGTNVITNDDEYSYTYFSGKLSAFDMSGVEKPFQNMELQDKEGELLKVSSDGIAYLTTHKGVYSISGTEGEATKIYDASNSDYMFLTSKKFYDMAVLDENELYVLYDEGDETQSLIKLFGYKKGE